MWYLGTVWLEGCGSSSLLPSLTSSPILPCNRSECTNLQQLLVALWFGLWLFQEDPKTREGETRKRHCSCCLQLPSCVITAMWVVFYLYFVLHQWLAAKCGLKQKQNTTYSIPTQTSFLTEPRIRSLLTSRTPGTTDFKIISCFRGWFFFSPKVSFQSTI